MMEQLDIRKAEVSQRILRLKSEEAILESDREKAQKQYDAVTNVIQSTNAECVRLDEEIHQIQKEARENGKTERPFWPMIVLRTPKGWTGPKVVDGNQIEGTFRAHQVPMDMSKPEHLDRLKEWMLSYKPEELFDENGRLVPEIAALAPEAITEWVLTHTQTAVCF